MFSTCLTPRSLYLSAGLGLLAVCCMPAQLAAQTGKSLTSFDNICLAEAKRAEAKHGIPSGLLQSITRVESGRKMVTGEYMPWAWTLNDRGEGLFFDDRDAALAYLIDAVATPDHSVDVGCMQVNTKWHADGFLDIADMLDPVHNASYAAGFLLDLHAAHQSWDDAVKHYHSSEPRKNVAYHRRVLAELERYMGQATPTPPMVGDKEAPTLAANPVGEIITPIPDAGSTDLALVTRAPATVPVMVPATSDATLRQPDSGPDSVAAISAPSVAEDKAAQSLDLAPAGNAAGSNPMARQDTARDPILEKQPNLAPHRSRVEHFRRILAEQAG